MCIEVKLEECLTIFWWQIDKVEYSLSNSTRIEYEKNKFISVRKNWHTRRPSTTDMNSSINKFVFKQKKMLLLYRNLILIGEASN